MLFSQPTPIPCQCFSRLAAALDGRSAVRLALVFVGAVLARGRRPVTSWIRAAGLSADYKPVYTTVAAAGKRADAIAAWLVLCFVLTAVLIPMALRLPRWIEFELVLAAWSAIWLAVLTRILYTGQRVADDHQMREPRNWFASDQAKQQERKGDADRAWWDGFLWGTLWVDGDAVLIVLGLFFLLGLIWVLFEVAIPVLLFLLYFVTRGMLARVVNDRHHCRGRLGRALGWGLVWSTVYTAPLAAAVWFIHYAHQQGRIGG
jgi:hypothetical protein